MPLVFAAAVPVAAPSVVIAWRLQGPPRSDDVTLAPVDPAAADRGPPVLGG